MLSFWEQDVLTRTDWIVVGAGIVGLQTALELRQRRPQDRIVVLERGLLPAGASSRNAGFACFGSLTEILSDIRKLGDAAALQLVEQRWLGLQKLRGRLSDAALGYEPLGGYELLFAAQLPALEQLDAVNQLLKPLFGQPVFSVEAGGRQRCGFSGNVQALLANPFEGQIHSGRAMQSLAALARSQSIEIVYGAEVTALEPAEGKVAVQLRGGLEAISFVARGVALCTNGISRELLPDCGIVPGRGQVIVTEPIAGLPWKGTYHLDEGYYYFRNVGDRVLLGGGRNLDFPGEETTAMNTTPAIQQALETLLAQVILPERPFTIAHRWAGIMGFTADKLPRVQSIAPQTVIGFGCNGMGVALGAHIASQTAQCLLDCA
ncbi:NAD(P)/FAD-dependent oxidoreductase [Parachitinimonas caeni]|uniref:FAD-dependent oxidoreductase n=1 Tax=Parachitinimonas caeni TaxID=3031301 RepID=A0ABT7E0T3_9NEIS|nr:FAD-dependent oxidoreductase [Parachitinimonas caeni]MDK2125906.1 FAD-dependent oxidoreductase [Parachitinimonas caeni]